MQDLEALKRGVEAYFGPTKRELTTTYLVGAVSWFSVGCVVAAGWRFAMWCISWF